MDWITHKSKIIPVGVMARLQDKADSPEHLKALVEKYLDSQEQFGGLGEMTIKYRVILKGEEHGIGKERDAGEPNP